jgi:putative oxidoreductase
MQLKINTEILWNAHLLLIRIWIGNIAISGGQSILRFFSSQELRDFFVDWFGKELGFPAPLLMAFLAKSTEFFGGILICFGFVSRIAALLVAFVMLVATLTANLNYAEAGNFIRQDGLVTIPTFLFAGMIAICGPGKYSVDHFLFRKRHKLI